jgi:hypothetical protein
MANHIPSPTSNTRPKNSIAANDSKQRYKVKIRNVFDKSPAKKPQP